MKKDGNSSICRFVDSSIGGKTCGRGDRATLLTGGRGDRSVREGGLGLAVVRLLSVTTIALMPVLRVVGENLISNGSFENGDTSKLHSTYKHASFDSLPGGWNVDGDVTIGVDAQFSGTGYKTYDNTEGYGWAAPYGPGYYVGPYAATGGGAYGGIGGAYAETGNTNTNGFENAPYYPGSPGTDTGNGGGAVRIAAGGTIRLDGRIYVTGSHNTGSSKGSGSGGGVWLTCRDFSVGDSALIEARGGSANDHTWCYGGSGGRVAIMTGSISESQIDRLYETGTCDDLLVVATNMNDGLVSPWPALVDVHGGVSKNTSEIPGFRSHGRAGTAVYLQSTAGRQIVTVTGDRETTETDPAYGQTTMTGGSHTFRAPAAFSVGDGRTRVPCLGYTWSNVNGESGEGDGTEFTIDISCATTVSWKWGTVQHRLTASSGGMGTVSPDDGGWYDEGASVTLTAVPAAGCSFDQWVGSFNYREGVNTNESLTLTMDRPREAIALFKGAAARTVTWTGAADTDWFNSANWNPAALPTSVDAVVIPSGTVQVRHPSSLSVGSLAISNAAELFVAADVSVETQSGYLLQRANIYRTNPILGDDDRPYSFTVVGDYVQSGGSKVYFGGEITSNRITVAVGGDMTITGDNGADRSRFQIYASGMETAAEIERYRTGGARLTVSGDLIVDGYADFTPVVHRYTGATVPVRARNVTVGTNAVVDVDMRGYGRKWENPGGAGWRCSCFGPGADTASAAGASYGGKGTANAITECGYPAAPFYAGSGTYTAERSLSDHIHSGGGAVRIHAENRFRLDGCIYADGLGRQSIPGGSGGGVWLTCRKFLLGEQAYISVRGGKSDAYGYGGGAGGRIAIGLKFTDKAIDRLYDNGSVDNCRVTNLSEITADAQTEAGQRAYRRFHNDWSGRFRTDGELGAYGDSSDVKEGNYYRGGGGTAVLVEAPPSGFAIIAR